VPERLTAPDRPAASGESDWPAISVAAHPRAARSVRRIKAWAGLAGFLVVGLLSWQAGADPFTIGVRALATGVGLYLAAWAVAVKIWQALVVHETETEARRLMERREELLRQIEEKREEQREREERERAEAEAEEAVA
jgi:hypothetical protein